MADLSQNNGFDAHLPELKTHEWRREVVKMQFRLQLHRLNAVPAQTLCIFEFMHYQHMHITVEKDSVFQS